MRIDAAKKIPLEEFLEKLGYQPARRRGSQLWYLSPLRQEKTPSFKVNTDLNLWFDFGLGKGGTIVDLASEIEQGASVPDALRFLSSTMGSTANRREFTPSPAQLPSPPALTLLRRGPVRNRNLKSYLRSRGIGPRICRSEVEEICYLAGGRSRVALGFANDCGGYELRNKWFKGTLGSKAISTRPGDANTLIVFEGFFDYLTFVTLRGRPAATTMVLNSVALRERAVEYAQRTKVGRVELFRDNDAAGESLLSFLRDQLPDVNIVDRAINYAPSKDLNEWFVTSHLVHGAPSDWLEHL